MDISSNINQLQSLIGNSPAQRDTKTSIDKKDQKEFAEASSQLTQSLSQLRAIEALKKNIKLKK